MDTNTFWLKIWQTIITGMVVIAMTIGGCTVHQNDKVAEAIKGGATPERARIAFSSQVSEAEKIAAILSAK